MMGLLLLTLQGLTGALDGCAVQNETPGDSKNSRPCLCDTNKPPKFSPEVEREGEPIPCKYSSHLVRTWRDAHLPR